MCGGGGVGGRSVDATSAPTGQCLALGRLPGVAGCEYSSDVTDAGCTYGVPCAEAEQGVWILEQTILVVQNRRYLAVS